MFSLKDNFPLFSIDQMGIYKNSDIEAVPYLGVEEKKEITFLFLLCF